jgi:hypothetical protein
MSRARASSKSKSKYVHHILGLWDIDVQNLPAEFINKFLKVDNEQIVGFVHQTDILGVTSDMRFHFGLIGWLAEKKIVLSRKILVRPVKRGHKKREPVFSVGVTDTTNRL